jgi:adenosylhomocysteine nucleosidase
MRASTYSGELTKEDILVVVALESEIQPSKWIFDIPIVYTGIGKVNAAISTQMAVISKSPKLVVNLGTAGALHSKYLGLHEISSVIQRDFDTSPLAPRGQVPFQKFPSVFTSDFGDIKCGTGDSFMTASEDWVEESGIQLVDMELYSIARVCAGYKIPWRSTKYVTDIVGQNSGDDWQNSLESAQIELIGWFQKNFKELIEAE